MTISERVRELFVVRLKYSRGDIADAAQVSKAAVSKWFRKKTNISEDNLERLLAHCPAVRREWLLEGKGPMFRPDMPEPQPKEEEAPAIAERNKRVGQVAKHYKLDQKTFAPSMGVTDTTISRYLQGDKVSDKRLDMLLESFPNISRKWLYDGIGEMLIDDSVQEPPAQYLPKLAKGFSSDEFRELINLITRMYTELNELRAKLDEMNN